MLHSFGMLGRFPKKFRDDSYKREEKIGT